MLEAAARLYIVGAGLDWQAIAGERSGHTPLPTYPFQRTRFWPDDKPKAATVSLDGRPTGHPLLGRRVAAPLEIYATELGTSIQPWTRDHRIFGHMLFPAAGFLELALAAAEQEGGPDASLESVSIGKGLLLPEDGAAAVQVVVTHDAAGRKNVQVFSAAEDDAAAPVEWQLHATAYVTRAEKASPPFSSNRQDFEPVPVDDYYGRMGAMPCSRRPAHRTGRTVSPIETESDSWHG
jgi:acyl transferase domain-containing protein